MEMQANFAAPSWFETIRLLMKPDLLTMRGLCKRVRKPEPQKEPEIQPLAFASRRRFLSVPPSPRGGAGGG